MNQNVDNMSNEAYYSLLNEAYYSSVRLCPKLREGQAAYYKSAWSLSPIMAATMQKTSWMRKESKAVFYATISYAWTIMGSSKKHKEKDKDRDRERRREKERKHRDEDRERDRDSEKEKSSRRREEPREERSREKRGHGSEEDIRRVDKKKAKREDYDDLYEYAVEESARDDFESSKLQINYSL